MLFQFRSCKCVYICEIKHLRLLCFFIITITIIIIYIGGVGFQTSNFKVTLFIAS